MDKRIITPKQEQALRLCHQDFKGLTQSEAAEIMGISQQAISKLLTAVEKVMPYLFPLLTKTEAECYHLYCIEGWNVEEIAEHLGVAPDSVYKALQRARDKGMLFTKPKGRALSYEPSMDNSIKYKF